MAKLKLLLYVFLCGIICILIFSISCSKEDSFQTTSYSQSFENLSSIEIQKNDENLRDFTLILRNLLEDKDFRVLLKRMANEKFDGDYDILYSNLIKERINGNDISILFNNASYKIGLKSTVNEIISKIYKNNFLQISIPINIDKWNADDEIPIVTFKPTSFSEKSNKPIVGYRSDGTEILLDPKIAPEFPVIVVGYSERVNEDGELIDFSSNELIPQQHNEKGEDSFILITKSSSSVPMAPSNFDAVGLNPLKLSFSWNDNSNNEEGFILERSFDNASWMKVAQISANQTSYLCSWAVINYLLAYRIASYNQDGKSYSSVVYASSGLRFSNWVEYITHMKFSDLSNYESWLLGAPEIKINVVDGKGMKLVTGALYEPSKRKYIDDKWWNCDIKISSWHPIYNGQVLSFDFLEYDGSGSSVTYTVPFYNDEGKQISSISVTVKAEDIHIGQTMVKWWEPIGQEKNLGKFQFITNQKSY